MKDFGFYNDEELMREIKADNMFAFDLLYLPELMGKSHFRCSGGSAH
jgi:hypothetical protein